MGGAHDDDVARHHRRGVQPDLGRHRIDRLIVVLLEIDDAVVAECRDAHAGLRVQRDQLVSRSDVENSLLFAVGPVREAAAGQLPRSRGAARAFALAVHPELFAGFRVERDDGPAAARGGIQHAVRHHRRRLEHELGTRTEVIGLEAPRDGELAEVGGVDLIERRVPGVSGISAVGAPLAVQRTCLSADSNRAGTQRNDRDETPEAMRCRTHRVLLFRPPSPVVGKISPPIICSRACA